MKKALVTGINGQDGAYLAAHLLDCGYTVVGGSRRSSLDERYRLRELGIGDQINFINFDLMDPLNVYDVIISGNYDEIYNLAAQSFVGASWDLPIQTSHVDALGPLYILDAIKRSRKPTRFYQASTSEMYGLIQEPIQNEQTPFYPRSPYGVSKLFAHSMTVNYRESYDMHCSSGILFNHESPLRGHEFVTKKITMQLSEIKLGLREKLSLGNLNAKRDWGYAKEYVVGMHLMLQQSQGDDYVLATGSTTTVRDFVKFAANALGMDIKFEGSGQNEVGYISETGHIIVDVSKEFFRPAEVDVLLGDASKAKKILNWSAKTSVQDLATLMVESDINQLSKLRK